MSFDSRDIRRSMDVFTLDNVHLGMVLAIRADPRPADGEPKQAGEIGETGATVETSGQPGDVHGEALGPMPTEDLGNRGPRTQSNTGTYGATSDGAPTIGPGILRVGKWWGLRGRHTIPLDTVLTVSLERVVLKLKKDELERWFSHP